MHPRNRKAHLKEIQIITGKVLVMVWFLISLVGILLLLPLHFLSVEHTRLDARYGMKKGKKIGSALGMVSGWGYFIFLFGIWLSPQPQFALPFIDIPILIVENTFVFSTADIIFGGMFIALGVWLGIGGVRDLGLQASETHRAEKVVIGGLYSKVRHPQYLGAILSHVGMSLLLSQLYSLLVTPIIIARDYVVCKKEEKELVREFGSEYIAYFENVPMFIPRRQRGNGSEAVRE